ncbi:hypothetical protein [Micromonospora halophytica]|uniref:MYXO-CTERM domain-containing protein n=1 Tax=Micromonospora halophytica TaxID=47864 RepID=A0A1C5HEK7_9ACTN|nr:hypothetical protein [Micromonospora halophytica]SCG44458.1 hypothetical protein GA0070560_10450 [Micromonospora halophytica]
MANKMLGKVVAGAALGGASLLVFTPGIAFADGAQPGGDSEGKVIAKPHAVKPGETVKLLEICPTPQEHAYVWSKVTGKVKLKPVDADRGKDKGGSWGGDRGGSWEGDRGGSWGEDKGGSWGGDRGGKGENGKGSQPVPPAGDARPPAGGWGGGFAADVAPGQDGKAHEEEQAESGREHGKQHWKGHEYGQEAGAEGERSWKGGERGSYGQDAEAGAEAWQGHGAEYAEDATADAAAAEAERGWEHKKDFVYYGEAQVAPDAAPGTYELKGSCGEGELVVLPRGPVDGGDGGMTTTSTDRGMALGGASMIGAAALGGIVLMRRRRADGLV